jgi:hypothetical protein
VRGEPPPPAVTWYAARPISPPIPSRTTDGPVPPVTVRTRPAQSGSV